MLGEGGGGEGRRDSVLGEEDGAEGELDDSRRLMPRLFPMT